MWNEHAQNGHGQGEHAQQGREAPGHDGAEASNAMTQSAPLVDGAGAAQQTIDQVRELLFGHEKRRTDQTFVDLRAEMSQQIEALRAEMRQHVDTLTNCLIDLEHTSETRRLSSISDIGKAIADLGASIQSMGAQKTDE